MNRWVRTVVTSFVMVGMLTLPVAPEAFAMRARTSTQVATNGLSPKPARQNRSVQKPRNGLVRKSPAFHRRGAIDKRVAWTLGVVSTIGVAVAIWFGGANHRESQLDKAGRLVPVGQAERLSGHGGTHVRATATPEGAPPSAVTTEAPAVPEQPPGPRR